MKLRVTDDAKADLGQIKTYIGERNAITAEGVIERIRKTRSRSLRFCRGLDTRGWWREPSRRLYRAFRI
jgi:plasmid stabilization system protein ParE